MKSLRLFAVLMSALLLSGCAVVGGIFKAGMWTGVILVIIVAILVGFVMSKARRR